MLDTPEAVVENIRILSLRDIPEGTISAQLWLLGDSNQT